MLEYELKRWLELKRLNLKSQVCWIDRLELKRWLEPKRLNLISQLVRKLLVN